jgi:hypothetical protein
MAIVYVHASRARDFREEYIAWCRAKPKVGFGRIVMEPPEGPPLGEEKQFVRVPDDFLTCLTQKEFPYRLG